MPETWTYYDANTIQVAGDLTAKYLPNQLLRVTQDGAVKFFLVTAAVTLVGGNTHLTINGGGVYTLTSSAITTRAMAAQGAHAGVPFGFTEAATIAGASSKTTPANLDEISIRDSVTPFGLRKLTWVNIKATLKDYFDTIYSAIGHAHTNILPVYNVLDYGAHGDGVTDDAGAIHAAATAAYNAGGGIVYLPPGTYREASAHPSGLYDDSILVQARSGVFFQGAGRNLTTLKVADGYVQDGRGACPILGTFDLTANWGISDMTIDFNGQNNLRESGWSTSDWCCIGGARVADVRFERLVLKNCPGKNVINLYDASAHPECKNALIVDVEISNSGNDLADDMLDDFTAIYSEVANTTIERCYIHGSATFNEWNACGVELHSPNSILRTSRIEYYKNGVYIASDGHTDVIRGMRVIDNDIIGAQFQGILVWLIGQNFGDILIRGNYLEMVPNASHICCLGIGHTFRDGITYEGGYTERMVVEDNTVVFPDAETTDRSISQPIGIGISHVKHAEISRNNIYNSLVAGLWISLDAEHEFNFNHNIVTHPGRSSNAYVTYQAGLVVISLGDPRDSKCNIFGNVISSPFAGSNVPGIFLHSDGTYALNVRAKRNEIDWAATECIQVHGAPSGSVILTEDLGAAAPASGYHSVGSVRWNSNPTAGGVPGWVCVAAGSPGTWAAMASLGA